MADYEARKERGYSYERTNTVGFKTPMRQNPPGNSRNFSGSPSGGEK